MKKILLAAAILATASLNVLAQQQPAAQTAGDTRPAQTTGAPRPYPIAGADETTPSKAEYFTWMSHTNEGPSENQTYAELDFFQWLYDTYGMQLDIFAFDAGMLDGRHFYGSTRSERFRNQYPHGLGPIRDKAAGFGASLGVWGGPDGFGDTPEEAAERMDMVWEFVRDYNLGLFKMDGVCGQLRPSKYDYFEQMMAKVREIRPDFVLLNHRLKLGPGTKYSTTYLLGGDETYIDVFMTNTMTAPHHRGGAIARRAPEDLTRLTEDHGVCLSSCLDYWEDDLILQAFGRELIMAPQIYANPWLLRDDEYPMLAFIYNLHRAYRDILVNATRLPEAQYGPEALSRGDGTTRFLTLRNLTWEPVKYTITLGEETGLDPAKKVKVRQYHPYICDLGSHPYGKTIEVEVLPFRAALIKLTIVPEKDRVAISGIPYQIINDKVGDEVTVKLLGMPGETYNVQLEKTASANQPAGSATVASAKPTEKIAFKKATVDGKWADVLAKGRAMRIKFPGDKLTKPYHRKLAELQHTEYPREGQCIYDAMTYAADNNALELRSLERSGPTKIPQVQAARDALFGQRSFAIRDCWDRRMFDDDPNTSFSVAIRDGFFKPFTTALNLDLGEVTSLDKLVIETYDEFSLQPYYIEEGATAYISKDLKSWKTVTFLSDTTMEIDLGGVGEFRYFHLDFTPLRITEISGIKDGKKVDRTAWHATNLFPTYWMKKGEFEEWKGYCFTKEITLDEIPEGAYLCIAIDGKYPREGAWAALKIDGEWRGCPDRAPSYSCNPWGWEVWLGDTEGNYTYYYPLTADMQGKTIEVWAVSAANRDVTPSVWMSTYPIPFEGKKLQLR
ncbi:MAG: hypothetical protein J5693_03835 [Bacteroidales bacterium]|nr:hypothetical protein [Bacteroidales bacterium]